MNILAINNLSNINLWNLNKDSKSEQVSNFGLKMAAPLSKDTVSFKATPKVAQKALEANRSTVKNVRAAMRESYVKINRMFENLFSDLKASENILKILYQKFLAV